MGRFWFDVNRSHVFSQSVLTAITLIEVGLDKEGLGLEPGVKQGFPSARLLSLPYWGQGQVSSCWSRSPEGWFWANSVPPPGTGLPRPREEQCWNKRGRCEYSTRAGMQAVAVWSLSQVWTASDAQPVQSPVIATTFLFRCHLGFEPPRCLMAGQVVSLVTAALLAPVWSCYRTQAASLG